MNERSVDTPPILGVWRDHAFLSRRIIAIEVEGNGCADYSGKHVISCVFRDAALSTAQTCDLVTCGQAIWLDDAGRNRWAVARLTRNS